MRDLEQISLDTQHGTVWISGGVCGMVLVGLNVHVY